MMYFLSKNRLSYLKQNISKHRIVVALLLFLFIFCFAYKFLTSVKNGEVAQPVSVKVVTLNKRDINRIKVYRVSPSSRIYKIDKKADSKDSIWLQKGRYFINIWLYLPNDFLENIKKIDVNIGKETFSFASEQLISEWRKIDIDLSQPEIAHADDFVLIEAPLNVRGETSAIPLFKKITNWPGDGKVLFDTFLYAFLFAASFALVFIIARWAQYLNHTKKYLSNAFLFALVMVFVFIYISPLLSSQYYKDDLVFSSIRCDFNKMDAKVYLFDAMFAEIKTLILHGRFLPLSTIIRRLVFYYFDNVFIYKSYILSMVLINLLLFYIFIRKTMKSHTLSIVLLFLLPIFFQFRASYHDPILGYFGLVQIVFSFIVSSLILLQYYLESKRKRFLITSVLLYIFSLLIYEISIPFILIHLCLIYHHYKKIGRSVKILITFLSPVILDISYMFYLRLFIVDISAQYTGVKMSFDVLQILKTFFVQLFSALPLSYILFSDRVLSLKDILENMNNIDFMLISILFITIFILLSKRLKTENIEYNHLLTIVGLLLYIVPAIPVSISYKYQRGLSLGLGYLPVYIQYFGLLMFLFSIFILLDNRTNIFKPQKDRGLFLCILFAITYLSCTINFASNKAAIEKQNIFSYPNRLLKLSLENNIVSNMHNNSIILLKNQYLYKIDQYTQLFHNHFNRTVYAYTLDEYTKSICQNEGPGSIDVGNDNVYVLEFPPGQLEETYIKIGKLENIICNNSHSYKINISGLKYFVSNEFDYRYLYDYSSDGCTVKEIDNILSSYCNKYKLYSVSFDKNLVDFNSLVLF